MSNQQLIEQMNGDLIRLHRLMQLRQSGEASLSLRASMATEMIGLGERIESNRLELITRGVWVIG